MDKFSTLSAFYLSYPEMLGANLILLEQVKSHMTYVQTWPFLISFMRMMSATHSTKLKLYSGFHRKVDDHNVILQEREQVLDSARKRLVKESGNVLG